MLSRCSCRALAAQVEQHGHLARVQVPVDAAQRVHVHLAHAVDLGQGHGGQGAGVAAELQVHLLQMVKIEVGVTQGVDKLTRLQIRHLGHHLQQERIGSDIERHAQENVGAALVELAGKPPIGYVELKQAMAWRQGHLVDLADVPGADNETTRVRLGANLFHDLAI
jgi:hypothetical protein